MNRIEMVIQRESPADVASGLGRKAYLIVCDRGYLSHQKAWRTRVALSATCGVVQIESDVVVPIEIVSNKAEYATRTIRPKIHKHLNDYLLPFKPSVVKKSSLDLKINSLDLKEVSAVLNKLSLDRRVGAVTHFFKPRDLHFELRWPLTTNTFWLVGTPTPIPLWPGFSPCMIGPSSSGRYSAKTEPE